MDCRLIQPHLVAYHFGTAGAEERRDVDAHLVTCRACLSAYLEIKRHAEVPGDEEPGDALLARLRADVAREIRPTVVARVQRWLAGPVPRYRVASAAALVLLVAALVAREARQEAAKAPEAGARLDTAHTALNHTGVY
jgi:predicted anti-sigma-YlaC factor YlaD